MPDPQYQESPGNVDDLFDPNKSMGSVFYTRDRKRNVVYHHLPTPGAPSPSP